MKFKLGSLFVLVLSLCILNACDGKNSDAPGPSGSAPAQTATAAAAQAAKPPIALNSVNPHQIGITILDMKSVMRLVGERRLYVQNGKLVEPEQIQDEVTATVCQLAFSSGEEADQLYSLSKAPFEAFLGEGYNEVSQKGLYINRLFLEDQTPSCHFCSHRTFTIACQRHSTTPYTDADLNAALTGIIEIKITN